MCRQLFFPCGILCCEVFIFSIKKKATPFVSIALLHSLLPHHVAFPLEHTACIIADIKITCQNTSALAPLHLYLSKA